MGFRTESRNNIKTILRKPEDIQQGWNICKEIPSEIKKMENLHQYGFVSNSKYLKCTFIKTVRFQ